ncbi:starch synthase, partial [Achromobacter xylosoxidans]
MTKIRTLVVAGEAFPLAKTGGLGDAITGMARGLCEAGVPVTVLLPAYRGVRQRLER